MPLTSGGCSWDRGQLGLTPLCQGVRLPQWGGAGHAADLTTGRPGRPQQALFIFGVGEAPPRRLGLEDALVVEVGLFVVWVLFLLMSENLECHLHYLLALLC